MLNWILMDTSWSSIVTDVTSEQKVCQVNYVPNRQIGTASAKSLIEEIHGFKLIRIQIQIRLYLLAPTNRIRIWLRLWQRYRPRSSHENMKKSEIATLFVVVYHVTTVAIRHGLLKKFWPLVIGCVLRTTIATRGSRYICYYYSFLGLHIYRVI